MKQKGKGTEGTLGFYRIKKPVTSKASGHAPAHLPAAPQVSNPCTPAQQFSLLKKTHHETMAQGPWALAAQEVRCSDLILSVQRALPGDGLGLPQFPYL